MERTNGNGVHREVQVTVLPQVPSETVSNVLSDRIIAHGEASAKALEDLADHLMKWASEIKKEWYIDAERVRLGAKEQARQVGEIVGRQRSIHNAINGADE